MCKNLKKKLKLWRIGPYCVVVSVVFLKQHWIIMSIIMPLTVSHQVSHQEEVQGRETTEFFYGLNRPWTLDPLQSQAPVLLPVKNKVVSRFDYLTIFCRRVVADRKK